MTPVPPKVRAEVEARSGGMCELCEVSLGTHLHHRKMRSQGGSNSADNLLHVCLPCHNHIHANPASAYEAGWLIRSWDEAS